MTSGVTVVGATTGESHTCAWTNDGSLYCWGNARDGRIGLGNESEPSKTPRKLALSNVISAAAGEEHTCAVTQDGALYCFGNGTFGRLGNGAETKAYTPTRVAGVAGAVEVTSGMGHTCVRFSDRRLQCFGLNSAGQLGIGNQDPTFVSPQNVAIAFDHVSAGSEHTCGTSGEKVYCWGNGNSGNLGNGEATIETLPVLTSLTTAASVTAGSGHTCAASTTGQLWCWGAGGAGQLGIGPIGTGFVFKYSPERISTLANVKGVDAGYGHSCAWTTGGDVYLFGLNDHRQTGLDVDPTNNVYMPTKLASLSGVAGCSAGGKHTCAWTSAGDLSCWGADLYGQTGTGDKPLDFTFTVAKPRIVAF